jgi:stage III sporulation protein AD
MNIMAVVGLGLVGTVLAIVIKQYRPEFGVYISLITGILILAGLLAVIRPVIDTIYDLAGAVQLSDIYGEVLLKSVAVCYIVQLASDTCRDAGETAIAGKLETGGRIAIILLSLPLFRSIANVVIQLMG